MLDLCRRLRLELEQREHREQEEAGADSGEDGTEEEAHAVRRDEKEIFVGANLLALFFGAEEVLA